MSNSRYRFAFSRQGLPEVLRFVVPQNEGGGNAGCALHPRSRVQRVEKTAHEHTGQRRTSDIPCAMALRLITSSCVCKICQNVRTGGSRKTARRWICAR